MVFTLARRWLHRLTIQDRLELATYAVSDQRCRSQQTPAPIHADDPGAWTEVAWMLWQSQRLMAALTSRVIADAEAFVDLEELRQPGMDLADAFEEAGDLLRQLERQLRGDGDPDVAPLALSEVAGAHHGYFSLAELRAARDRGLVRELLDAMDRRRPTAGSDPEPQRWRVSWEAAGRFHATPVTTTGDTTDTPAVEGWAAHPAVVEHTLSLWTIRPRPAQIIWDAGSPGLPQRLAELNFDTAPEISIEQANAAFWGRPDRLAEVVTAIADLRASNLPSAIPELVADRAARLRAEEPQLPDLATGMDHAARWTWSTAAEWVRTRAIVSTPDKVWGEFDRLEPSRGARWVPDRARELLAVPTPELPNFLARHFVGRYGPGQVFLLRIPGPAGPLYALGSGGSHRTHLSRILGLPWMFAVTTLVALPRRIHNTRVTPTERGIEGAQATIRLWQGLLDRGVIRGNLIVGHPAWSAELRLDHAPAPWMLLPADHATLYNRRYELLYPGTLDAVGIPPTALASATSWESWLTTP